VAKPELGTKRVCPETGRKFYDLNKDPVISPYTGKVVPMELPTTRARPDQASVAQRGAAAEEVATPEPQEAEFVSLEDADAEAQGAKGALETPDIEEESKWTKASTVRPSSKSRKRKTPTSPTLSAVTSRTRKKDKGKFSQSVVR
jgi:uncharacterized protein (TIGR02300 family)